LRLLLHLKATCVPTASLLVVGLLSGTGVPIHAQSSAYASVAGTVRGAADEPLAQATVSLIPLGGGQGSEVTTSGAGAFAIRLVRPGSYELRVEALGYRPLVARTLSLSGGDTRRLELTLTSDPPPVESVDTIMLSATSSSRWRGIGTRFGDGAAERIPHRWGNLGSIVALSSSFDEALGAQGLPGGTTLVVADGIPYYRAPHPMKRSEALPAPLVPVAGIGAVIAAHGPSEIDWPGATGGYAGLATKSSARGGFELGGFYSGDPTWSSGELDFDAPSLLSYGATGQRTVPFDGGSQLIVVGDVLEHQTPLTGRVSEGVATELSGLDADLLTQLTEPGVETYSRYAGLARYDVQSSTTSSAFVRGNGSYTRRSFEGAGPLDLKEPSTLAEESIDVQLAGGYLTQASPSTTIDLRGGFSGSSRDFNVGPLAAPPAFFVESRSTLGGVPFSPGASSRNDLVLIPTIRHSRGRGAWKAGLWARVSNHTMDGGEAGASEFLFSNAAALLTDRGYVRSVTTPEASFGTQEYGVFAEYEGSVGGLQFRFGGRYDYERIAIDRAAGNEEWFTTTGLANIEYPGSFGQFALRGSLLWTPTGGDRTRVVVAGSLREGDVDTRAIGEVLGRATEATSLEFAGTGLEWPAGSIPSEAEAGTTLTLFGPDLRAPRTTTLTVRLLQRLTSELTFFVEGSTRRTEFLLRRRDLNLPVVAMASDPNGRAVYGTLAKDGALVTATGDDSRRFSGFGEVWALDPDGWSEYRGATMGVEYITPSVDLFGSYTYSETTDNWVGAASGLTEAALRPGVPEASQGDPWSEGTSDFDVPHRAAAGVTLRVGPAEISGLYRYRSGLPFTPGYRLGVDANGDGSVRNDVAFVPDEATLGSLLDVWSCLEEQTGGFAARNSCRGPVRHTVNARVRVELGEVGGRSVSLTVDALNLVESSDGVVDDALLLIDPSGGIATSADGSTVTLPTRLNDAFDTVRYPTSPGRMIRIGARIGR